MGSAADTGEGAPYGPVDPDLRVVGGDGGATHLRLALSDGRGHVIARMEGRGRSLTPGRLDEVVELLARQVGDLVARGQPPRVPDALCLGLAGAGRPEAARTLERRLLEAGAARRVRITTDAHVALEDAFPRGPGVLLVSGTGSIALARRQGGRVDRVGGWGALLGDEGSAYRLGLEGLRAALRGWEGRGPATGLTAAVEERLDAPEPEALLRWATRARKADVAALAPEVVRLHEGGDPVARGLVADAVEALVAHVQALAGGGENGQTRDGVPVALAGGLLESSGPLRSAVGEALNARGFRLRTAEVDGVRGALRCALRLASVAAADG